MSDNGWSAISPENRDPLFRIALKEFGKAQPSPRKIAKEDLRPKRKPGQKDRAYPTRCGAI